MRECYETRRNNKLKNWKWFMCISKGRNWLILHLILCFVSFGSLIFAFLEGKSNPSHSLISNHHQWNYFSKPKKSFYWPNRILFLSNEQMNTHPNQFTQFHHNIAKFDSDKCLYLIPNNIKLFITRRWVNGYTNIEQQIWIQR